MKLKVKFYGIVVRPTVLYGWKCWVVSSRLKRSISAEEIKMISWMSEVTRKGKIRIVCVRYG